MAAQNYEFTGKTVDEAVAEGLKTLKLRPDQVDIEVLNKGSRGIFGIGSEPAQVRLTPRTETPAKTDAAPATPVVAPSITAVTQPEAAVVVETSSTVAAAPQPVAPTASAAPESAPTHGGESQAPANEQTDSATESTPAPATAEKATDDATADEALVELSVDLLAKMVNLLGFQAEIRPLWKEANDKMGEYDERYLLLDIHGSDLGALIGRRGETLDNIQYLLRLMVNQRLRQWKNIVVDVEQYKARRVTQLTQLAHRMADQVISSGRSISLEPMPPNERRVVHLALRDHPAVYTESTGEGERRKVNIVAKH
ncbi:MAG: RNA-binding cell elongation regulator Jag/EloR [Caldilineaceae bacterium]